MMSDGGGKMLPDNFDAKHKKRITNFRKQLEQCDESVQKFTHEYEKVDRADLDITRDAVHFESYQNLLANVIEMNNTIFNVVKQYRSDVAALDKNSKVVNECDRALDALGNYEELFSTYDDIFRNILKAFHMHDKTIIEYANEEEFKELERNLKKYNMLAYKELAFTYIPNLRMGKLDNAVRNGGVYEIPLGHKLVDVEYKLLFKIEKDTVKLLSIEPKERLLYKTSSSTKTINHDMFKINLFNMIDKDR